MPREFFEAVSGNHAIRYHSAGAIAVFLKVHPIAFDVSMPAIMLCHFRSVLY